MVSWPRSCRKTAQIQDNRLYHKIFNYTSYNHMLIYCIDQCFNCCFCNEFMQIQEKMQKGNQVYIHILTIYAIVVALPQSNRLSLSGIVSLGKEPCISLIVNTSTTSMYNQ